MNKMWYIIYAYSIYIFFSNKILSSYKKKQKFDMWCYNMDGLWKHYALENEPEIEEKILYVKWQNIQMRYLE